MPNQLINVSMQILTQLTNYVQSHTILNYYQGFIARKILPLEKLPSMFRLQIKYRFISTIEHIRYFVKLRLPFLKRNKTAKACTQIKNASTLLHGQTLMAMEKKHQ